MKQIPMMKNLHITFLFLAFLQVSICFGQGGLERDYIEQPIRQNSTAVDYRLPPPTNDNCASATVLTVDGACINGTTSTATLQGGETICVGLGGGMSAETVWYRFTASNDSLVLGWLKTNSTNCTPAIAIYGPFAPGGGCLPAQTANIYCQINNGDPGIHSLLTGLNVGSQYLIQVIGVNCGGGADRFANFCISISNPARNALPAGANSIDACGTAFTGTTSGGTWNSGTGTAFSNLDNNPATTCGGCPAGLDVPYVTNNTSWFTFCAATAGTWNIQVNGITNCVLPAPNNGVQATVHRGTPNSLSFIQTTSASAPYRIAPGGTWTSSNFAMAAGECAYVSVDGFAGDECNYNLTLTNVAGGCILLQVQILELSAKKYPSYVELNWKTLVEFHSEYFEIEKSLDGIHFETIGLLRGAGDSETPNSYQLTDNAPDFGYNYYRLKQTTTDGLQNYSKVITVYFEKKEVQNVNVFPNPIQSELQVSWTQVSDNPIKLTVFDAMGRLMMEEELKGLDGINNHSLDVKKLAKGVYFIRLVNSNTYRQTEFIKE